MAPHRIAGWLRRGRSRRVLDAEGHVDRHPACLGHEAPAGRRVVEPVADLELVGPTPAMQAEHAPGRAVLHDHPARVAPLTPAALDVGLHCGFGRSVERLDRPAEELRQRGPRAVDERSDRLHCVRLTAPHLEAEPRADDEARQGLVERRRSAHRPASVASAARTTSASLTIERRSSPAGTSASIAPTACPAG